MEKYLAILETKHPSPFLLIVVFVHIILEQQVSLASALATLNKLKEKLIGISPVKILTLTVEEM